MSRHPFLYSFIAVGVILFFLFIAGIVAIFFAGGRNAYFPAFGDLAVMEIEGPIFNSAEFLKELHRYQKSSAVKAIVVRIDSPGGAVAPSQEIFEELKKIRKTKKVIVSMGTVAASGGYYIACAADKIFASPGTITGSIGVIMESFGLQHLLDWAKIEPRVIKSGEYKDIASPFNEMTAQEKVYLQELIDNMYLQFKTAVSIQRQIPMETMEILAQGKIYTEVQALENGLIDQLGTLYDAIEEAKKLSGLPKDAKVIWPRKEKSFLELVFSSGGQSSFRQLFKNYFNDLSYPLWIYSSTGQKSQ